MRSLTLHVLALLASVTACATGYETDPGTDDGPGLSPLPPPAGQVPPALPDIDGEYGLRTDTLLDACAGQPALPTVAWSVANLVGQDDPAWFDLVATGGGLRNYTYWDTALESDLTFETGDAFGSPPTVIRHANGKADGWSLDLWHDGMSGHYDAGVFVTDCAAAFHGRGQRLSFGWSGVPRGSIDGQWRVRHEVLESWPDPPGAARMEAIETTPYDEHGAFFRLSGTRFAFVSLPRDLPSGKVDNVEVTYLQGSTLHRLVVDGTILENSIDLTIDWQWREIAGPLIRHLKDRYVGAPRFEPHVPDLGETARGVYLADFQETSTTCGQSLPPQRRAVYVLPDGQGRAVLTYLHTVTTDPFIIGSDGGFQASAARLEGPWKYRYAYDGTLTGDGASFTETLVVVDPDTETEHCRATYEVAAVKRYRSVPLPEP